MIVIPSVSIGNVPQLAVDLLISTYGFEFVKSLDDSKLCPFIGPMDHTEDEPATDGVATPVQLFRSGDIYLVQLRSPPLSGLKTSFIESLHKELSELDDSKVLIVGSANAGMNTNRDNTFNIQEVSSPTNLPDSGFVNEALNAFNGSAKAIISWVYEGDNFEDSRALASAVAKELNLPQKPFKQPVSWTKVYGKQAPTAFEEGLYS